MKLRRSELEEIKRIRHDLSDCEHRIRRILNDIRDDDRKEDADYQTLASICFDMIKYAPMLYDVLARNCTINSNGYFIVEEVRD